MYFAIIKLLGPIKNTIENIFLGLKKIISIGQRTWGGVVEKTLRNY